MKITINNEEVLCNKDFTINEEMLNTSSVILNNVYPKTWEQDKDYVSRFYYPKDYSKCKIFNEIEHPTTKETAEGTSFSITADLTKQYEIQTLKGQLEQEGTPTPSSPQPINITTGRQLVSVWGKNILKLTRDNETGGSYDSETDTYSSTTRLGTAVWYFKTLATSHSYTFSTQLTTNAEYLYCFSNSDLSAGSDIVSLTYGSGGSITNGNRTVYNNSNLKYLYVTFRTIGSSVEGKLEKPMLEVGETPTTYEEYKGQDYEINLGKNLFDGIIEQGNYDGSTGNKTGSNAFYRNANKIPVQPSTTYTFSLNGISQRYVVLFYKSDNTFISQNSSLSTGTFTTPNNAYYVNFRCFQSDYTDDYATLQIQLEKGSQATSYSPYKTPIYLGKIGTYQDYIFKNTTENPLYDSNLEEGQWYMHKEIGRVVLNGSHSGLRAPTKTSGNYRQCVDIGTNILSGDANLTAPIYSNKFIGINRNQTYNEIEGIAPTDPAFNYKSLIIYCDATKNMTYAQFQTWLSSNNVELYYVLNTPTNTLIEDEELINQLNAIELLEGLNNVSITSPNLPFIMSLMYNYQEGYTEEDILFCGVVENTGNISLNPRYPHYCNLQVLDFKTFLSEGETLDFVIYEKTVLEAINQVIGTISEYGFVLGNVNILHSDDVIGAYSTKDKTAYDVFNYIADITQSRWTTRMIDENTVAIDFYDPSLMPQGTSIEYTQNWFTNHKIQDMSFSYSSRDYRNKQVMLSGEVYANIETTEIIVADGYQTQFNTIDKIGYVSSMLLNGSPVQVITKEEYDLGYEGDFIYQPGNKYFESVELVSTGAIITIVYYAVIEGREVILNQDEISRVEDMIDRKGIIARYENRNDATTTQELQAIGQSYLKYKGSPEVILRVESLENIWNIGERVEFDSPLEELTTEYMVKKKTINYITTQDNIFYTYELSSSFNSETEINYFDNQRSKMMGNIGVGEVVSRNIDIENTANIIFYGLEVNEVQISGTSSLQAELQAPLGVE